MLIAIDIGNTTITIGVFEGDALTVHSIGTHPLRSAMEYKAELVAMAMSVNGVASDNGRVADAVVVASVVPAVSDRVVEAASMISRTSPFVINHLAVREMSLDLVEPARLGADRIAESYAAMRLCGAPVAVIDFGTATTVNFVGRGNIYKGGAIMPGLGLMLSSMYMGTAALPEVRLKDIPQALGKDTEANMLSGIIFGSAGAVRNIIEEVEAAEGETYKVAVTGGHMDLMLPYLKRKDLAERHLALYGLKFIYEERQSARA